VNLGIERNKPQYDSACTVLALYNALIKIRIVGATFNSVISLLYAVRCASRPNGSRVDRVAEESDDARTANGRLGWCWSWQWVPGR